jgi:hypothetical protein
MFKLLTASAVAATVAVGSASAGVVSVADLTGQTGGYNVNRDLGVTISGDSAIYMIGTMQFDDISALNSAFNEANLGLGGSFKAGFGIGFGGNTIVISRNGTRATATSTFASGVPTTLLMKFDQITGDTTLWVDPDLSLTEAANTPEATVTLTEANSVQGQDYDGIVFRGGDFAAPSATTDFTDFAVYFGGDTPFIPEPSSLALLGLGGLLIARRRRG